jgi:nucleotidyltransferase substrate binding protein (TIGR01987 family)
MVNATIPYLKHFFQALPHPPMIAGTVIDLKHAEMCSAQGGWGTLSSSRLFYNVTMSLGSDPKILSHANPPYPWHEFFLHLGETLDQLGEMVQEPENHVSYVREATIQRFEFCIELFWQIFRQIGKAEGQEAYSQKGVVRVAYILKLIDNKGIWLGMMDNRNQTSHTYTPTLTREIYHYIPFYYGVMRKTYDALIIRFRFAAPEDKDCDESPLSCTILGN